MRRVSTLYVILAILLFSPLPLLADLYMVSPDTQSVRRFTDQGDFISDFVAPGAGGLVAPYGLAFGPDGNLYVSDSSMNRILRYNNNGTFIDVFAADSRLNGPTDLVFHGDDLFVGLWNNSGFTGGVARVDANTGVVETTFGTGAFRRTHALAFGADGNLYASTFDMQRIRVFNPDTGALIRDIGTASSLGYPMGITFDKDQNLIVNNWQGDVRLINSTDGSLLSILVSGLNNTQWNVLAPDGTLIIDSFNDQSLGRYDANGTFIENFVSFGVLLDKYIFHQSTSQVVPQSFLVTRGTYVAGDNSELANSDNADLSIQRTNSDIQSRTEFEVKALSPVANPTTMEFTLEGAVFARSQVNQSIEIFDYVAGAWEQIDARVANRFSDITVTVAATGDLSRFVEAGTMCIEARVRYQSVNPRQQFSSGTDQAVWTIGQ